MKSFALLLVSVASIGALPLQAVNDPNIPFDLCEQVMNCEFYQKPDGSQATRFIEGMEPNSDFVRALEANATLHAKRQDGPTCDQGTQTCTRVDVTTSIRNYGDAFPRDVADRLYEHCLGPTCGGEFNFEASYDTGGLVPTPRSLVVRTGGSFATDEIRDVMVRTMTDVVGANIEVERRVCNNPRALCSATIHRSPSAFGMRRTTPGGTEPALAGFLEMRVDIEETSTGICGTLTGAIGAALPGPGATVLGTLAPILCSIAN